MLVKLTLLCVHNVLRVCANCHKDRARADLHKVVLQLFICEVDAQLLEGIEIEILEAEDVEDANGAITARI